VSRTRRQLLLAVLTLGVTAAAWFAGLPGGAVDRASLATAWICALLFVMALSVGPARATRGEQPPLNILTRRDLGIWVGLSGLLHFVFGNVESMNGIYVGSVTSADLPFGPKARMAMFNWGAITGTILAVVLLALLALSNNASLRRLGPRRWKRWQRLSYFGFALTILHGLLFQLLERRSWVWIALLLAMAAGVLLFQLTGRRNYSRLVAGQGGD
jgi:DMSO/TMAO reductase YedYZ heme-binding membrane subunit